MMKKLLTLIGFMFCLITGASAQTKVYGDTITARSPLLVARKRLVGTGYDTLYMPAATLTANGYMTSTLAANMTAATLSVFSRQFTNVAGTTYTLLATDHAKMVLLNNSGTETVTVPAGLPIGFTCQLVQFAQGQTSVAAAAGVVLNAKKTSRKIVAIFGTLTLTHLGNNVFILTGDL